MKNKASIFCSILLLFFSIFLSVNSFASIAKDTLVEKKYETSIRYNHNYGHYLDFDLYNYNTQTFPSFAQSSNFYIGNQSISIVFLNKKNFTSHEFNLLNFNFSSYQYDKNFNSYRNMALSYQFNYFFLKNSKSLFLPYAGISMKVGFEKFHEEENMLNGIKYIFERFNFANQINLVPGFRANLSKRIYLDFSVPINLFRGSLISYKNEEIPTITYYDGLAFFNKQYWQARLGVGITLNPSTDKVDEKYLKTIKFNFNSNTYFLKNHFSNSLLKNAPSISIQSKKHKSIIHEFNFPDVNFSNNSFFSRYFSVSGRYQVSYLLLKKADMLFNPYIGLGALLNYNRSKYSVYTSLQYKESNSSRRMDNSFFIAPGFQLNPNERIYLDVSFPVTFYSAGIINTDITTTQTSGVNMNASVVQKIRDNYYYFPEINSLSIRVGVGVRL